MQRRAVSVLRVVRPPNVPPSMASLSSVAQLHAPVAAERDEAAVSLTAVARALLEATQAMLAREGGKGSKRGTPPARAFPGSSYRLERAPQ